MFSNVIKGLFYGMILTGIVVMIGTIGASDCNLITTQELVSRVLLSGLVAFVGYSGLKVTDVLI